MEQPRQPQFTADEFITWALEQKSGRHELDNGMVVSMTPERASHAIVKLNTAVALRNSIKAHELPCTAFPNGMAVKVNDHTVYEPDALVRCSPALPGDALVVLDPVIVVEVVSPSSRGIDRGVKLAGYFSLPSLRHYLIIDTDKRVVIHHRRGDDGRIEAHVRHEGAITLDPPGLVVNIPDIFAGL